MDEQLVWLRVQFEKHQGNGEVMRQELLRQGIRVSQRTVERLVEPWRKEMRLRQLATVRFETPPDKPQQADCPQCVVTFDGERVRVHLYVLTLGYSRRGGTGLRPQATGELAAGPGRGVPAQGRRAAGGADGQRPGAGPPPRPAGGALVFHPRLVAFAKHWGVTPKACRPNRPPTKEKDEPGCAPSKRTVWRAVSLRGTGAASSVACAKYLF